jgi:hypothetical protein
MGLCYVIVFVVMETEKVEGAWARAPVILNTESSLTRLS